MTLLTSQEFPAQSMSVRTAKLFKSDVQSVPLSFSTDIFAQSITPVVHCQ